MQPDAEIHPYGWSAERRPAARVDVRFEKMAYRAAGTSSVPARGEVEESTGPEAGGVGLLGKIAALESQLEESERTAAARLEQARREGADEVERARRQEELRSRMAIEAVAQQVGAALKSFDAERNRYFAQVEGEVVGLALAIAARILNREALLDPLLLSGAVRVALGQLGETTGVRLRCPAAQVESWRDMLGSIADLPSTPEVAADTAFGSGECVLETLLGTVDLGVRAQLEEIERGFFDLLEQRPRRRIPEPMNGATSGVNVNPGGAESQSMPAVRAK